MSFKREIEYRAWDGAQMIYADKAHQDAGSGVFVLLMDLNGKCSWNNPYGFHPERSARDLVLMQFIGLRDKNGTKIYDGDIIKGKKNVLHLVEYDIASVRFAATYDYGAITEGKCSITQDWLTEFKKEVVGNIYENRKLLK